LQIVFKGSAVLVIGMDAVLGRRIEKWLRLEEEARDIRRK